MLNVTRIEAAAVNPGNRDKLTVALKEIADLLENFEVRIRQMEERLVEIAHLHPDQP